MKAAKLLYQSGNFLLYTFKHSLFSESDILCKPCAVILTNFPGYLLDFCGCCCFSQIHRKQPLGWISRFLSGQCFQGSVPHFQNKGWWCLVLLLTNTFLCVCMIMMHTCVCVREREGEWQRWRERPDMCMSCGAQRTSPDISLYLLLCLPQGLCCSPLCLPGS